MVPNSQTPPEQGKDSLQNLDLIPPPGTEFLWEEFPDSVRHYQRFLESEVLSRRQCEDHLKRLAGYPRAVARFWFYHVYLYEHLLNAEAKQQMTPDETDAFFHAAGRVLISVPNIRVISPTESYYQFTLLDEQAGQEALFGQETWDMILDDCHRLAPPPAEATDQITNMGDPEPCVTYPEVLRQTTMDLMRDLSRFGDIDHMTWNKQTWYAFVRLAWFFLEETVALFPPEKTPPLPTIKNTQRLSAWLTKKFGSAPK